VIGRVSSRGVRYVYGRDNKAESIDKGNGIRIHDIVSFNMTKKKSNIKKKI